VINLGHSFLLCWNLYI